jgi:hypothetical protein
MPSFTPDKIHWMRDQGLIPETVDIEEVCKSYDLALQWYELSQAAFALDGTQQISIDPELLKIAVEAIHKFIQSTPIADESSVPPSPLVTKRKTSFTK